MTRENPRALDSKPLLVLVKGALVAALLFAVGALARIVVTVFVYVLMLLVGGTAALAKDEK